MDMITSGNYPNLYTDISYTLFVDEDFFQVLKVIMENDILSKRILFGSDFYMVEPERLKERKLPMKLRAYLGEQKFKLIAEENPKRFLGIQ
jgi:uncharacterized protein